MNYTNLQKFKKRNILVIIFLSMLILNILLFPKPCMNGCLKGLKLFITALFPSLFPFLVICNLIIYYNGAEIYGKLIGPLLCGPLKLPRNCSVVIILSALCGYPMGAKYTCDLYNERLLDYKTSEKLLNIASNASPLFILGTIAINMFNNKKIGYILLFSNYVSSFFIGLLLRDKNNILNEDSFKLLYDKKINNTPKFSIGFSKSIDDAISVVLKVAGFVIIFAIINEILQDTYLFKKFFLNSTTTTIIFSLLLGILEITNGCNNISLLNIPLFFKIGLTSFLISFSGICIILQVYSFLYKYGFSMKKYVFRKFFQGIISSLISMTIFFIIKQKESVLTISMNSFNLKYYELILICIILFIIPFCIYKIKSLIIK